MHLNPTLTSKWQVSLGRRRSFGSKYKRGNFFLSRLTRTREIASEESIMARKGGNFSINPSRWCHYFFFSIDIKNAHKRDSSKSTRSVYPASNDYFRAGRKFLHHCTVVSCRDRFNIANESLLSRAATSYFENIFPYCNSVSIAMMIKTIKMIITSTINEEFQSPSSTK